MIIPALLLVIAVLVALLTIQSTRALRGSTALLTDVRALSQSVNELRDALADGDDEDVLVSLREAKHFTSGHQHLTQNSLDEVFLHLGLPKIEWTDRAEARRVFMEDYHARRRDSGAAAARA